jgi:hypothetical protein
MTRFPEATRRRNDGEAPVSARLAAGSPPCIPRSRRRRRGSLRRSTADGEADRWRRVPPRRAPSAAQQMVMPIGGASSVTCPRGEGVWRSSIGGNGRMSGGGARLVDTICRPLLPKWAERQRHAAAVKKKLGSILTETRTPCLPSTFTLVTERSCPCSRIAFTVHKTIVQTRNIFEIYHMNIILPYCSV